MRRCAAFPLRPVAKPVRSNEADQPYPSSSGSRQRALKNERLRARPLFFETRFLGERNRAHPGMTELRAMVDGRSLLLLHPDPLDALDRQRGAA